MRTILRIARLELQVLFFSPIAWLIAVAFSVECAIYMSGHLHTWVMSVLRNEHPQMLTLFTYVNGGAFWTQIDANLMFYTALLTMGVFSREISSGSIKLLLSSPIRPVQIVAGKFLGLLVYGGVLMAIIGVMVAASGYALGNLDYGWIFSGMVGIYLLLTCYMALGLMMSSFTPHQVVAGICTFSLIYLLSMVGEVGQKWDLWREIASFLEMGGRSFQLAGGVLSTSALAYFIIVPTIFLGCAIIRMHNTRDNRPLVVRIMRYVVFIVVMIFVGYLTHRPAVIRYMDFTLSKGGTPTPVSRRIMEKMKDPVKVHVYVNVLDEKAIWGWPWNKSGLIGLFAPEQPYIKPLAFDFTYYYDSVSNDELFSRNPGLSLRQLAMKVAKASELDTALILTPEEIRRKIDLRPEENRVVMQVESGGKIAYQRLYDSRFPFEGEILATFKKLTQPGCLIGYVTGHGERDFTKSLDEVGYKTFFCMPNNVDAMINQGFDVRAVRLTQDIAMDVKVLVIADPVTTYSPEELARLKAYVERGGNLIFTGEQGRQQALGPIGDLIGVRFGTGYLVQPSRENAPAYIKAKLSPQVERLIMHVQGTLPEKDLAPGLYYAKDVLTQMVQMDKRMIMPGATSLEYTGGPAFHVDTLLLTDTSAAWQRLKPAAVDTGMVTFDPAQGDVRKPFPLGLALSRQVGSAKQRIVVLGDADCLSNAVVRFSSYDAHSMNANHAVIREALTWMSDGQYPVDVSRPMTPDNVVKIDRAEYKVIKFILEWVFPGLLLVAGTVLLMKRRRK